ncbi:hypothetical protein LEP1GSC185_2558 [Leptospira licerasiae serovar Varillal str. VAR 010]|uniref:Uncharacterized protein n=2 Tax=Leptospira licerasiae TaxID=447106 RepID=A0ABP2RH44_9LEPT|nr:hypothetical protein LEP1GSC185_2558 [Leptospira licerasiae serovar Varillal str. VAR 010]EJZ41693.1 hypothetical protein LEP1GSC178_0332 [Leptospira licerasiae str. MMD4847]
MPNSGVFRTDNSKRYFMNRDILKILLSGLLILLLGSLAFYLYVERDRIAAWYKDKNLQVEEKSQPERTILTPEEVPDGKDLSSPSQNFDSDFSKPKDSVTEPSSQPLPKDYEVPGLGKEKKESLSAKTDDKPETKVTESADLPKREEMDRPRTKQRDESLVEYDDGPKPKKEKRHSKKYKKRRTAHSSVNAKISSLEKRVGRLEKKLGMKNGSPKKKSKISLRKRVEILEQEVSGLKNKSKAE